MTLTKENTVLSTVDLTDEQKGIVFDIISENDPSWIGASWDKGSFIGEWGIGILKEHATIAYSPTANKEEPYNSEQYFKNVCFDKVERTNVTFEQWVELHKSK